jgi:hypothetical protein
LFGREPPEADVELTKDEQSMLAGARRQRYGQEPAVFALLGAIQIGLFIVRVALDGTADWQSVTQMLVWTMVWSLLYVHVRFCRTAYGLVRKLSGSDDAVIAPTMLGLSGPVARD